jgi:hypothetical protein
MSNGCRGCKTRVEEAAMIVVGTYVTLAWN